MQDVEIVDISENVGDAPVRGLLISRNEVWFPYSVEAVKLLRPGLIIGVRNTASVHLENISGEAEDEHYALLRIESVETRHFIIDQIRQDRSDAPISVEGLLEKYQKEWRRTTNDAEENNLRIVAEVSDTNLEVHLPLAASAIRGYTHRITGSAGTAMLGEIAYLLDRGIVEMLVNRDMEPPAPGNTTIVAGTHTLYSEPHINVWLEVTNLFRRHFGIFGFTGAGKSNLLSTLVSEALKSSLEDAENVVLFDVNNEYFGLLLDVLFSVDAHIIFVDNEIGDALSQFLAGDYSMLDEAVREFVDTSTFSSALNPRSNPQLRDALYIITRFLMSAGVFKLLHKNDDAMPLGVVLGAINSTADELKSSLNGTGRDKKRKAWANLVTITLIQGSEAELNRAVSEDDFGHIIALINIFIAHCEGLGPEVEEELAAMLSEIVPLDSKEAWHADLVRPLRKLRAFVEDLATAFRGVGLLSGHGIEMRGLVSALSDGQKTLVIALGNENSLRQFSHSLGQKLYDFRRRRGITDPTTVFIFDEADIFIPAQTTSDEDRDAVKASKAVATTLARRGRKYGLGLGIATQRIAYLDTSILAQLGTYLVGKLPRASDRQRITEGFGVEKESLNSGLRTVGDWTVLSHVAVGDKGAPIPVHFSNADTRIVAFIEKFLIDLFPRIRERAERNDYVAYLQAESASCSSPVVGTDHLP